MTFSETVDFFSLLSLFASNVESTYYTKKKANNLILVELVELFVSNKQVLGTTITIEDKLLEIPREKERESILKIIRWILEQIVSANLEFE